MPLKPGDEAPDFTLLDQNGEPFTLSESLRQRQAPHLVYFYPKADTPGCPAQAWYKVSPKDTAANLLAAIA